MKILLLTDIPPCSNYTAGIVLAQLVSTLSAEKIVCFCVKDKDVFPVIPDSLSWLTIEYVVRPRENWGLLPRQLGAICSLLGQTLTEIYTSSALVSKIVNFAKLHKVDAVWCTLEGQTMIRLALPVVQSLQVPLLSQVWDHPTWWLRERRVDSLSKKRILSQFESTLKASLCCATASWAMAFDYEKKYGCKTIPFLPSLDTNWIRYSELKPCDNQKFSIALAGQIYATDEWNALLNALEQIDWKIGGKLISIKILGRYVTLTANSPTNIEFLGWRSQQESLEILSQADLLYCPYWFSDEFREITCLSFPSKLTTYLAAGRPIFMHGPVYSSPTLFLKQHQAAIFCESLDTDTIISCLQKIVANYTEYQTVVENGRKAFLEYLTLDQLTANFHDFLATVTSSLEEQL